MPWRRDLTISAWAFSCSDHTPLLPLLGFNPPRDIAVMAEVWYHPTSFVWDMGSHGCPPIEGIIDKTVSYPVIPVCLLQTGFCLRQC
jgi:hypothetical protein